MGFGILAGALVLACMPSFCRFCGTSIPELCARS